MVDAGRTMLLLHVLILFLISAGCVAAHRVINWTGVRAIAVLAQQVYTAPVTHPLHSSHFIAKYSTPARPFASPDKEVIVGMPRGVSCEHKAHNEVTS